MIFLLNGIKQPNVLIEIVYPFAIIIYIIWYEQNQIVFQGYEIDSVRTMQLLEVWQKQYIFHNKDLQGNPLKHDGLSHFLQHEHLSD